MGLLFTLFSENYALAIVSNIILEEPKLPLSRKGALIERNGNIFASGASVQCTSIQGTIDF